MSAATSSLNEVDQEIEGRKARLRMLKEEYARKKHVAHPDKAPLDRDVLDAAMPDGMGAMSRKEAAIRHSPTPREQAVLDAAAERGGNFVQIAEALGKSEGTVRCQIQSLRAKGLWPYGKTKSSTNGKPKSEFPALRAAIVGKPKTSAVRDRIASDKPVLVTSDPVAPVYTERTKSLVSNHDPNADPEILVIQRVLAQLHRLPTHAAMERVLAYIDDRISEGEHEL